MPLTIDEPTLAWITMLRRRQLFWLTSSSYTGMITPVRSFRFSKRCVMNCGNRRRQNIRSFPDLQFAPLRNNQGGYTRSTRRLFASSSPLNQAASENDDEELSLSHDLIKRIECKNKKFEEETLSWLKRVVVGMSLCPFAEKPMKENKLKTVVVRGDDLEIIISLVHVELRNRIELPGTTLVVCPELHPDCFEDYLDVLNIIEDGLFSEDEELDGFVQIAPFHPLFCFDGSAKDSVDNWTNRSPYPIFHILREAEVSEAVDKLDGDAGKVWRRNVDLLNALGDKFGGSLGKVLTGELDDETSRLTIREILRDFRIRLQK